MSTLTPTSTPTFQEQRQHCQCCSDNFNPGDVFRYPAEPLGVEIQPVDENLAEHSIESPCIILDIGLCDGCHWKLLEIIQQKKLGEYRLALRFIRDYGRLSPHGRPEVKSFQLLVLSQDGGEMHFADFLNQLGSPWNQPWEYNETMGCWCPVVKTD